MGSRDYRFRVTTRPHVDDTAPARDLFVDTDRSIVRGFIFGRGGDGSDVCVVEEARYRRDPGGWRLLSSTPGDEWMLDFRDLGIPQREGGDWSPVKDGS